MVEESDQNGQENPSLTTQQRYYDQRWSGAGSDLAPVDHRRINFLRDSLAISTKESRETLSILDFGCGFGRYSAIAAEYGQVVGIDLSSAGVDRARCAVPTGCFHVCSAYDFEPESVYDVIMSIEVIEHIERQSQYVEKIKKLLRSGGQLLLTCPNKAAAKRYWRKESHLASAQPVENWLSISDLSDLLEPEVIIEEIFTVDTSYSSEGIMRVVNSVKVNKTLALLGFENGLRGVWERCDRGAYIFLRARHC